MSELHREVPRQMQFLKALVMFFAVILAAAALFMIYVGTSRLGKSGFDIAQLPVPDGCRVELMTADDDRLILSIGGRDDCRRLLIADMTSGKLIGQFDLKSP